MGLGLSCVIGPAFFSLIQTSLTSGFKAGLRFAIGISLSDILVVSLVSFGVATLLENGNSKMIISIVGGVIMIVFGVFTFLQKVPQKGKQVAPSTTGMSYLKFVGKGFLFNIANPGVWIYWVMPVGVAATMGGVNIGGIALTPRQSSMVFLVALLLAVLSCDILKCAIAYKLKTVLQPKVIHAINKVVGVILIIFGIYLAVTAFVQIPNPIDSL